MERPVRARVGWRPSLRAVIIVAIIMLGQLALVERMVASQSDIAHIIDISGAQRMRSQRAAYLAVRVHADPSDVADRRELGAVEREMRGVRQYFLTRPDIIGDPAVALRSPFFVEGAAFLGAVRTLVANPRDDRAYRFVLDHRVSLLGTLDAAVKQRARAGLDRNRQTLYLIHLAMLATIGILAVAWRRIILPNERTLEATIRKIGEERDNRRSLLQENPDAVGFFDRHQRIVFGNAAALRLLERGPDLVGTHLSELLDTYSYPRAVEAFEAALDGTPTTYESRLRGRTEFIDVEITAFPNIVNGSTVGVIAVAKDIRVEKEAARRTAEQRDRVNELYRIASARGRGFVEQIDDTLTLVMKRLGYEAAILSDIGDNTVTAMNVVGRCGRVAAGTTTTLESSLSRYALDGSNDLWWSDDLRATDYGRSAAVARPTGFRTTDGAAITEPHLGAYFGAAAVSVVRAGDRVIGSLILVASKSRSTPLLVEDREFLNAVASLVGLVVERRDQARRLDSLAYFDALTGLANRVTLLDKLGTISAAAARTQREFAVLYLDLDRFKEINDVFGHAVGDEVLRVAARRMQSCVRSEDVVARLGGDEFIILLPTSYGREMTEDLAERVLSAIKRPMVVDGTPHLVGVSIGIAFFPNNGNGNDLIVAADAALYEAKRAGRNRMAFAA